MRQEILGWMRLRLQAAFREKCRLQQRLAIPCGVCMIAHAGFLGGFMERNNYELGGHNLEYSCARPHSRPERFAASSVADSFG